MHGLFQHLFDSLMDQDTEILEGMSGLAAIWYIVLMSAHDLLVMIPQGYVVYAYIFCICTLLGGSCQIAAVFNGHHKPRRSAAFGGLLFWCFLASVAWLHHHNSPGTYGHPGAVAAYMSLAIGNALAYFKLGELTTNAGS